MVKRTLSRGAAVIAIMFCIGAGAARADEMAGHPPMKGHPHTMGIGHTPARVGNPAPNFELDAVIGTTPGSEFKKLSLKDFSGRWLVLYFYPADFTFVCPTEIKGFNDSLDSFKKLNAEVVGASTDSKWSHLAWIKRGDLGALKYPLLADFNKEAAHAYGVLDEEKGVALRGLFIIDPTGVVQYQVVHNLDVGRSVEETLRVLEALQTGSLCPLGWKPGQKTIGK